MALSASKPNNPIDKVRQLQRRLWRCAKRSKTRRFHALYDRVHRGDVLWEAWERDRSNKGAAGMDGQSIRSIEESGVTAFLAGIQADPRAGTYRPKPVKRRYIPKADGKQRPLGIPTVRDHVVQMAAKLVVEPIFEADFLASSYGFRPKKSATDALEATKRAGVKDVETMIQDLNPVLRGWGAYFRTGNADREFNELDNYIRDRLLRWQWRRGGQRAKMQFGRWPSSRLYAMGLHKLQGTVRYPAKATERRPSENRVRENRTHGLKGAVHPRAGNPAVR